MPVRFVLNGTAVDIDAADPQQSLLSWLRGAGLTGSKEGCAEGECGACAVAVLRRGLDGQVRYEAINSCLVPISGMHGQRVWSVEGVAQPDGSLHPVQRAVVEQGGSQCGYCTPGFIISMFCEYYRPGRTHCEVEAISGNLCRCTGYRPIVDALRSLPEAAPHDPRLPARQAPPEALAYLDYPAQTRRFVRPGSLSELQALRATHPEAVLIAGGTDLMVTANQRAQRWPLLISLEALDALRVFDLNLGELILGAGLTLSELEQALHARAGVPSMLTQLLPLFASPLIRNRATLGGNLVTASPIGDAAPALLALDAELSLWSPAGVRRLPLREFFVRYRETALAPDELLVSVHIPLPTPQFQRFYKVSKRVLDDISTVAAGFSLDLTQDGKIERLRLAFGGVAETPVRAVSLEQAAQGEPWRAETIARLLPALEKLFTPLSDHRGSAAYRRAMVRALFEKFFAETQGRGASS